MRTVLPEKRRGKLKKLIENQKKIKAVETVCGLEALAVTEAEKRSGNIFEAMWFSGLCCAAYKGMPDNEYVDFSDKLRDIENIFAVSDKPLIADMDTGGTVHHFCRHICELERIGVSGVVAEDKTGLKQNSLYGSSVVHKMEDSEIFSEKIYQAKCSLISNEFMIFARTESLIAGESVEKALERTEKYLKSGADGIVIHSIMKDGSDVFEFSSEFRKIHSTIPLVFIPTAYSSFSDDALFEKGANIVIYANQLMRSAYQAMVRQTQFILDNKRTDESICEPVKKILNAIDGKDLKV